MTSDSPKAGRGRSPLWSWITGGLLVVVIAFVVMSLDEAPPDVSDLRFEPLALSEDENAYVQLSRVAERVDSIHSGTDFDRMDDFVSGDEWDAAVVSAWLAPLDPVWPEYEAAVRLRQSQGLVPTSVDTVVPEIGQMMKLARLATLRARERIRAGQPDEALRIASTSLAAGRLIQESRSTLIAYLTGVAIHSMTFKVIQEAARHPDVSSSALLDAIAELEKNRVAPEALGYAFRGELYFYDAAEKMLRIEYPRARLIPGAYKPNKTRRIMADYLREIVGVAGQDIGALDAARRRGDVIVSGVSRRVPENIIGRMFLQIVMPTVSKIAERYLRNASEISVTQTLLAVRLHEKERGALPASLAELVPGVLPATPKDYYDGGDIKYSRDAGFIWAVGGNRLNITSADHAPGREDVAVRIGPEPKPKAKAEEDAGAETTIADEEPAVSVPTFD